MTIIDVIEGDITKVRVDAIVNAANSTLLGGGGVDGAIHRSGGPDVLAQCKILRNTSLPNGLAPGGAVATTAGLLPAKWVIHAVGPRYSAHEDRSGILRAAYIRSLAVADSLGARTVAFPLISGGSYGWPLEDAIAQQLAAIVGAYSRVEVVSVVAFSARGAKLTTRLLS